MTEFFRISMPWWHFALRGLAVYGALLLMMRLAGKRTFGEMSAFDVIVLVLVGGTLRTSIIGPDTSFLGALIAVAAILLADHLLAWICTRSSFINRLIEGYPTYIVREGEPVGQALRRCNVPEAALERALHAQGKEDLRNVMNVRLEPNGKITVTLKPAPGTTAHVQAERH
jgi:uncharacterized membrane protein YcaP (DUF421 family)